MENRIGFGRRLGAFLIDCVLVTIVAVLVGPTIGAMMGAAAGAAMANSANTAGNMAVGGIVGAIIGMLLALFVVSTIYFLVEGFTGWTFGKLILGIQVGNQDGTRANLGQLLYRYALKNCNPILSILAVFTGIHLLKTIGNLGALAILVGCFFVLTSSRQAFHDMIAKTAVYPRSKLAA